MKKLSKLIISVGAIAVASVSMALSAMAADTLTGTYDVESGVVTLTGVVSSGDQQTLLVLTEDASIVTADVIAQVDQAASITTFVLDSGITSGTYYIRMGGTDGTIQTGILTISGGGDVETVTIIVGDANLDGEVAANDVGYVLRYANAETTRIGNCGVEKTKADDNETVIVGDANLDGEVAANDVGYVLRYANAETTRIGNCGTQIEVLE